MTTNDWRSERNETSEYLTAAAPHREHGAWLPLLLTVFCLHAPASCMTAPVVSDRSPGTEPPLSSDGRWYVYKDADHAENLGVWSNWMPANANDMVTLDLAETEAPFSGETCIRVEVDFRPPYWCGVVVSCEDGYWGEKPTEKAYDLSKAARLVFHARSDEPGTRIRIKAAICGDKPYGDSATYPLESEWIVLEREWKRYEVTIPPGLLGRRTISPFCWVTEAPRGARRQPIRFYLDEVWYEPDEELGSGPGPKQRDSPGTSSALGSWPLFDYLRSWPSAAMVAYSPTDHDPRAAPLYRSPPTESIRADLRTLRPMFDGIVLYGYDPALTPRILATASELGFRAVLLGIWDPISAVELEGTAALCHGYADRLALGVVVGNEGIHFGRYTIEDVRSAAETLRRELGGVGRIPLTTSEPYVRYGDRAVLEFGDFLAPNIHPVFDRADLDVQAAAAWTRDQACKLANASAKPVVVKETGSPHGGKEPFTPSRQFAFWREFLGPGTFADCGDDRGGWASYTVAFESYDLPWKAEQSGLPFEDSWGLLSPEREPHAALALWRSGESAATLGAEARAHCAAQYRAYFAAEMDRVTRGTVVYDDEASGLHAFYPSNRIGDANDIEVELGCRDEPREGSTCIRIRYAPRGSQRWAGVGWVYPDVKGGNFGRGGGRDLTGATSLSGWIRASRDATVELGIGGLNRGVHHDERFPEQDAFGPVRKPVQVAREWRRFDLSLPEGVDLEHLLQGFWVVLGVSHGVDEPIEVDLDDVRFDDVGRSPLRLIRSYPDIDARNLRGAAFLYDNSLALIYFLSRPDADSRRRARILADTLVEAQRHDRKRADGRWRNAYTAGPLIDPETGKARLPSYADPDVAGDEMVEDMYQVSTDTGNMTWTIIALVQAYLRLEEGNGTSAYLDSALKAASWLVDSCRVDTASGGFSGGSEGWVGADNTVNLEWCSVEHCIDAYVAFTSLAEALDASGRSGAAEWRAQARHARKFVLEMWDEETRSFRVGTRDLQGTLNEDAIALDAQTWALLALGHDPEFRSRIQWGGPPHVPAPIEWAESNCRAKCDEDVGYRFSDQGAGVWFEGAAQMALAYRYCGRLDLSERALAEIVTANVRGRPIARLGGVYATTCPDGAQTGFDKTWFRPASGEIKGQEIGGKWIYPPHTHLGATVWFLFAHEGINPYWPSEPAVPAEK